MAKKSTYDISIRVILGVCSIALFLLACWLYVSFRSNDMILYNWFSIDCNNQLFQLLRITKLHPASWLIYNFPDFLWMLSFLLLMECIWEDDRLKWVFIWSMLGFAYIFETIQYLHIIPCTGDVWDFISYTMALLIYLSVNKLKLICHEKDH